MGRRAVARLGRLTGLGVPRGSRTEPAGEARISTTARAGPEPSLNGGRRGNDLGVAHRVGDGASCGIAGGALTRLGGVEDERLDALGGVSKVLVALRGGDAAVGECLVEALSDAR
jgi:hypothetical protein